MDRTIGVVPAAGLARRLGEPSRSKELERVYRPDGGTVRPVAYCLLEALGSAGIADAFVVTSVQKSDVREALGAGDATTPRLEHLVVEDSPAAAYTVSVGTAAAGERTVALGFPDVLWEGEGAFTRLSEALASTDADLALGIFPPSPGYPTDGVAWSGSGPIEGFEPADRADGFPTWTLAVWRPSFSRLLEQEVALRYGPWTDSLPGGELSMTQVFAIALERGLSITGVTISDRAFVDIGEPDRLEAALRACRLADHEEGSPTS